MSALQGLDLLDLLGVLYLVGLFVVCLLAFWWDEDDEEEDEKKREDNWAP